MKKCSFTAKLCSKFNPNSLSASFSSLTEKLNANNGEKEKDIDEIEDIEDESQFAAHNFEADLYLEKLNQEHEKVFLFLLATTNACLFLLHIFFHNSNKLSH